MPIRERTVDSARGSIGWLEAGAGWPVVLLHAFPLTAEMWRPQLERTPSEWRFIAPHFRRHDAPPDGEGHLDQYAKDVSALLDALAIDEAVVAGLSMGGYVAFALYRLMPTRFSGLVLADTRPQADSQEGRAGRERMRQLVAEHGVGAVADQMLPKLLSAATRDSRPDLVAHVRRMIESNPAAAVDAAIAAMMGRPDSTPDLPRIGCATLVLVGEDDELTPVADAQAMQVAIPRSALVRIAGAGHLSNLEQPELFSKALGDFLLGVI